MKTQDLRMAATSAKDLLQTLSGALSLSGHAGWAIQAARMVETLNRALDEDEEERKRRKNMLRCLIDRVREGYSLDDLGYAEPPEVRQAEKEIGAK